MSLVILRICILPAVFTVFQRQVMNVCAATVCSPPCLLVSNTTDILALDYKTLTVNSVVSGLTRAVAIDVHFSLGYIFWSDVTEGNIKRFRIDVSNTTTIITGIGVCNGLAVDWRESQLYWTDTTYNTISVSDLDGNNQSLLISSDLDKPGAIALDLDNRLMIWTDVGAHPKIEKASLSGNQRVAIVTTYLFYPNGIELDRGNKRIFWVDAGYDRVESMNYNGNNRKVLLQLHGLHPFGVVLVAPFLFFTDWNTYREVHKLDATSGKVLRSYSINGGKPMRIVAYDSSRQPSVSNPCAVKNGGCSHFCVTKMFGYECVCPTGLAVKQDGKTCEDRVRKFILFADADDNSTNYISLDVNYFVSQTLFQHRGSQRLIALDFDPVEDRVYWSDVSRGRIFSAFSNATSLKTLFYCNVQTPGGLAIDHVGRNIYWTDAGTNTIEVGRLDGTSRRVLIKYGLDSPRAIALAERNGMMYWTDWGTSPKIEQAEMDGSMRRAIVTENLAWPNGLTVDVETNRLFWTDANLDKIEVSDLNGRNRQLIMPSTANIHPFGLAVYQDMLYWTDWITKSISRFNLSSGKQEMIVYGLKKPTDIHVFDPSLTFSGPHNCSQNNGLCSDLCLLKPGGYRCACPTGIALKTDGKNCDYSAFYKTSSEKFMIVAEAFMGKIYKIPLEVPETPCVPLEINTKMSRPVALDYDPVEGKIYWTDVSENLVARAFLNGSSIEIVARVITPAGLAVDYIGRNIYWTDEKTSRIEVAKLDGSSRRSLITSNIEKPRAILLDIGERKMYWGGRGISLKIEQANMDGSARKTLVSSGLMWVNSLAMDYQNELLYWCDAGLDKIERVDLQGNNREVIVDLSLDSMHPFGLALFGDALFWSDWKDNSLHKYNMTNYVKEVVVHGMGIPMEVHIYDQSKDFLAVRCPALAAPLNGTRQGCTGTTTENYNTVCLFSCNAGFNAIGSQSRKCLQNRTWSGQDFLCRAVRCPALPAPLNGTRQGCTGTTTEYYNSVCLFSCTTGFNAVGSPLRRCLENGTWSGQDFLCQAVTCVPLEIPSRALLLNDSCGDTYGSSCVFSCQSGYVKGDGNVTRTCLQTGQWSGYPIYCIEPPTIGQTRILEYKSPLAISVGSSVAVFAALTVSIFVALFCMRKHEFLRRWRRYTPKENVGENNQGYNDIAGNQTNAARSMELQLTNVGSHGEYRIRRSSTEGASQIGRACNEPGAALGGSNSASTDEGVENHGNRNNGVNGIPGSEEGPVAERHCLCIHELVGVYWKKVLRNLSVDDTTIKNLDEDYKHSEVAEKCYQGLLKWKRSEGPEKATVKELCDALQKVGCFEALEALRNVPHQNDC